MTDSDVVIAGDGPTGLSAALLLAKNGLDVRVVGPDETSMHSAYLLNYLGLMKKDGTAFMETARQQCKQVGATLVDGEVESVSPTSGGFEASTSTGETISGRYLVLATGPSRSLAEEIGLEFDGDVISADRDGRTSLEDVYAGGWATREAKIQAAISVGDGATIAVDILSKEKGEPYHDFDVPPE